MQRESIDTFDIRGELRIKTFKDGKLIRELGPFKNKVVSSDGYGRNMILRWLSGDTTYPIVLNSMAVGTSSTAAADSDTALGASVASGLTITSMTISNNVLTADVFVASADLADGTYAEVGFFATLRMISRIIISPAYTKGTGEDTLFTYTLTLTG
jgi:hypothetical protein